MQVFSTASAVQAGIYDHALWGAPDALVNWCEPDYTHFSFIAETFNTLSNLYAVIIGLVLYVHYKPLEMRFRVMALLISTIGIGSLAFHGTLKYHMQLMDELPMLYSGMSMAYIVLEMPYKKQRYPSLPLYLILICIALTIGHILLKNAEAFFAVYGLLLIPAIGYTVFIKHDATVDKAMKTALVYLIVGFVCWELDRFFCPQVQDYHLHSVWHVCMSISGQYWLNAMAYTRLKSLGIPSSLIYNGFLISLNGKKDV